MTDTQQNLRGIFAFMREAGLSQVELLPYNASAGAKYDWLGRRYLVDGKAQPADQLEAMKKIAREYALAV